MYVFILLQSTVLVYYVNCYVCLHTFTKYCASLLYQIAQCGRVVSTIMLYFYKYRFLASIFVLFTCTHIQRHSWCPVVQFVSLWHHQYNISIDIFVSFTAVLVNLCTFCTEHVFWSILHKIWINNTYFIPLPFLYTVKKGQRFSHSQPGCHKPSSPWRGILGRENR